MEKVLRQKISDRIVIGKTIINEANLGQDIEILVLNNAVLILPSVKPEGINVFADIGADAKPGVLKNPSEQHDQYLYGGGK